MVYIHTNRLLKKAYPLCYASALAAHVPLKYAPLLDPRDALQLNLFEQPEKQVLFNNLLILREGRIHGNGVT